MCSALGIAMIVNTQLGGEGMWFWYVQAFHHGARLYSGLHTPLQPVYILLMDAWMTLFGTKTLVTEVPSLFFVAALLAGIALVLRESDWPDWQKAIVLTGTFALTVCGHSYRFDDYHVVAECLILYALVLLLWIARARDLRRRLLLVAALGALSGLTITSRLTDGAALLAAAALCLFFLVRSRRLVTLAVLLAAAALTWVVIVQLTGDSFGDYVSSTIVKAAGSKGGTGSIFAAPFLLFRNALLQMRSSGKWLLLWTFAIAALGVPVHRYWKAGLRYLVLLQLAVALGAFALSPGALQRQLLRGTLIAPLVLLLIIVTYLLTPVVAVRFGWHRVSGSAWDCREFLVVLPLAIWASYSAGAGGEPLTNYYAPMALLLLLVPVLQPFQRYAAWANASFVSVLALLALSGFVSKVLIPYSWQNYTYSPMFQNRQWYRHPVYGPLYIDSDLLRFSESVCAEMGGPRAALELLSLPYPYPNFFCATPPWHGYVQTFYDTSTRSTIERLMQELDTAPPQWIVYQRQLHILEGAERLYNHGQPLAQRELDTLILRKIATGQWQLVDKKDYLEGDGWYILRTRR